MGHCILNYKKNSLTAFPFSSKRHSGISISCMFCNPEAQIDRKNSNAKFLVLFSSHYRSLALKSSTKSHQTTTFLFKKGVWVKSSLFEWKIYHFEQNKLLYDDFLITTWERENERKKEPQIFVYVKNTIWKINSFQSIWPN